MRSWRATFHVGFISSVLLRCNMFLAGLPVTRKLCVRSGNKEVGVGLEKWRKLPTGLTSHFRLFHVAYDSLPTVIDVDVLDANVLLPTVT